MRIETGYVYGTDCTYTFYFINCKGNGSHDGIASAFVFSNYILRTVYCSVCRSFHCNNAGIKYPYKYWH
jgi:hypothetical protein